MCVSAIIVACQWGMVEAAIGHMLRCKCVSAGMVRYLAQVGGGAERIVCVLRCFRGAVVMAADGNCV